MAYTPFIRIIKKHRSRVKKHTVSCQEKYCTRNSRISGKSLKKYGMIKNREGKRYWSGFVDYQETLEKGVK